MTWCCIGVRDDKGGYSLDPASECGMTGWPHRGRLGKLKKEIIKRRGMSLPGVRVTEAGIPGSRIGVRDDRGGHKKRAGGLSL